jgi:formamidopyrimidine-DNA glycosylase
VPEGHTIHRLALDHAGLFAGRPVAVSSPQGRFDAGAALLDGRVLTSTDAWGKHLFHDYDGVLLHVHLGLYGSFRQGPGSPRAQRGAIRLRLVGPAGWAELRGPTACAVISEEERAALLLRLGPDPLRRGTDPTVVRERLGRTRVPIGAALMDQTVLAGVGNAYRAEVLFRQGLDPFQPALAVPGETVDAIWADLVTLMRAGVKANRIVTTRREHRTSARGPVADADRYYVYRRVGEPCRVCGTEVAVTEVATRRLYWCPSCQSR